MLTVFFFINNSSIIKEFTDARGLEIKLIEDFRERKIGNDWIEDFNDFSKRQWEDFNFRLDGGESLMEVQRRNISALEQILKIYSGKNVVIVRFSFEGGSCMEIQKYRL